LKIDAYASATNYVDHMAPVWKALADDRRGTFFVTPEAREQAEAQGVGSLADAPVTPSDNPIFVASSGNLGHVRINGRKHRAIMEHGAGLSYGGDMTWRGRVAAESPSYAGGLGRDAQLFLHPGEHPAARDRAQYPGARVEVVGSPRLDTLPAREPDGIPTVAVSFHWDTEISPETRSTFIFYRDYIVEFAKKVAATGEFRILGHGHPRLFERLSEWYPRKKIQPVRSFDDVCRMADLYVVDNSSTLYEFAATGRPVIALNAPFYRKHVRHGPRFWDAIPGQQVDEPADLLEAIRFNLAHPERFEHQREAAVDAVYAFRSGAAERAARVLEDWAQ